MVAELEPGLLGARSQRRTRHFAVEVGELSPSANALAIANAVYQATGQRIRQMPMRLA